MLAACGTGGHGIEPQTSTNTCGHIYRYMDKKGLAVMLTSIQSAGIAPEMNLRISVQTRNHASKKIHTGFETQDWHHQKSKTGISVTLLKGLMSSKNFFKKTFDPNTDLQQLLTPTWTCNLISFISVKSIWMIPFASQGALSWDQTPRVVSLNAWQPARTFQMLERSRCEFCNWFGTYHYWYL